LEGGAAFMSRLGSWKLKDLRDLVAVAKDRRALQPLDNLNTHRPKEDRWLRRHSHVHFHYTRTYSSWLNQVESWFSILTRQALRGVSVTSLEQVRQAMDRFVKAYNERATPF